MTKKLQNRQLDQKFLLNISLIFFIFDGIFYDNFFFIDFIYETVW